MLVDAHSIDLDFEGERKTWDSGEHVLHGGVKGGEALADGLDVCEDGFVVCKDTEGEQEVMQFHLGDWLGLGDADSKWELGLRAVEVGVGALVDILD